MTGLPPQDAQSLQDALARQRQAATDAGPALNAPQITGAAPVPPSPGTKTSPPVTPRPAGLLPRYTLDRGTVAKLEDLKAQRFPDYGGPHDQLKEDMVGGATDGTLDFSGIKSCIGFLCVHTSRVTGGHFTIATTPEQASLLLQTLRNQSQNGEAVQTLYVFGSWETWKRSNGGKGPKFVEQPGAKNEPAVVTYLKGALDPQGETRVYDQKKVMSACYRATVNAGRLVSLTFAPMPTDAIPIGKFAPVTWKGM